jgi:S1-C subfamily serine protease
LNLSRNSVASLLIEPSYNNHKVASGTGFVVREQERSYLVTNRHNVTGRDSKNRPITETAQMPDSLLIWHNEHSHPGAWVPITEPLYITAGQPAWLEHPTHGAQVDVAVLPLTRTQNIDIFEHDQRSSERSNIAVPVSADVSIIGFPFGLTGGGVLGIWSRGTIATEPDIEYDNLPLLLVDSRTRKGQSGSPVIFQTDGRAYPTKDGGIQMSSGNQTILVGIYSGRVHAESDLGFVWKARVINEIIFGGKRPSGDSLLP